ncbi:MAG: peptidoglycan DD-metalloendopeptidase family protein [Acidimicrobiales bacterium]
MIVAVALLGLSAFPSAAQDTSSTTAPPPVTDTTTAPPTSADTSTTAPPSSAPDTTDTTAAPAPAPAAPTTRNAAADKKAKAEAAGKLNAAVAADSEIAAGLQAINEAAQSTQAKVEAAQRSLESARAAKETATAELANASTQQVEVEAQLKVKAVEGFKSGVEDPPSIFFTDRSVNQTIRETTLLHQVNKGTAELLEELRTLKEDQQEAQVQADQAAADAEALQAQLKVELGTLQEQQDVQLRLKREAESRISKWESTLSSYAAEDKSIQDLINGSSPTKVTVTQLRPPSAYGMQWPVIGPVTSEYGYRIHPVYGTRKLHSGLDVSAPKGTPIAAAQGGTVLLAGVQGGYGNVVIVDHGDGVSTLYGHMSKINVSKGEQVNRGDVVGLVGATGTATGNHLHFEVRLNGEATNPRPYLPASQT